MTHSSLPARLRVLRAREGLTLIDAAEKLGIGRDTLSSIERGHQHPTFPTLKRLAEGYGVPVEDLLEEPEPASAALPKASAPPETGPIIRHVRTPHDSIEVSDEVDVRVEVKRILHLVAAGEMSVDDAYPKLEKAFRRVA